MAPNTALCFSLSGLSIMLSVIYGHLRTCNRLVGITGLIIILLGLSAFSGYLFNVDAAYGWGHLTRMAVHTGLGFIVFGTGIVIYTILKTIEQDSQLIINQEKTLFNFQIKTLIPLLIITEIVVIIGLTFFSSQLARMEKMETELEKIRFKLLNAASELEQSSEDLTRFARTYVATADEQYKENYFTILDIRNGVIPRPSFYGSSYWYLSKSEREERYPVSVKKALREIIKSLPFTEQELALMQESEDLSNKLVNLEVEAFNAMDGMFKDTQGEYTVKGEANQQLAINLLFSSEYHLAKSSIERPISEFIQNSQQRLIIQQEGLHADVQVYVRNLFFLFALFLIGNVLAYVGLRKKLLVPIGYLTDVVKQFSRGKIPEEIKYYDDELGNLSSQLFALQLQVNESNLELNEN
jgi:hypothetical protein